jgi:hypothetical protein
LPFWNFDFVANDNRSHVGSLLVFSECIIAKKTFSVNVFMSVMQDFFRKKEHQNTDF